jgi:hypothetical protein
MKINTSSQLRQEMEKIVDAILSSDSTPRMIMEANKANTSEEWDEAGDARRSDSSIPASLDNYDQAVEIIKSQ